MNVQQKRYFDSVKLELSEMHKLGIGNGIGIMSAEVYRSIVEASNSPMSVSECADMVLNLQAIGC